MRMATGEKWAIFGRNATCNADCRGGVFAVFAKISPPVLAAFRGYGVGVVFLGRDAVF